MEIKITRPQGTEDVTPKQIYKWHTVERIARETAESFGFHETRIPTFENTNLFLRSVGETTDCSNGRISTHWHFCRNRSEKTDGRTT